MADIVDSATRSQMMSAIKGRDTRPELQVRSALHAAGIRFRLHSKRLPGKPDIVLRRWNAVIEVRGCFWHRHEGCRFATNPGTDQEKWRRKFAATLERDERNIAALKSMGWRVAVVWECALRKDRAAETKRAVVEWVRTGADYGEFP